MPFPFSIALVWHTHLPHDCVPGQDEAPLPAAGPQPVRCGNL